MPVKTFFVIPDSNNYHWVFSRNAFSEDIEEMQEIEEGAECDESGSESDEGDGKEGKIEVLIRKCIYIVL